MPLDDLATTQTELFLPARTFGLQHAPADILIACSEGKLRWDRPNQRLTHTSEARGELARNVTVSVRIRGVREAQVVRNRWVAAAFALVVSIALAVSPELRHFLLWLWDLVLSLLL